MQVKEIWKLLEEDAGNRSTTGILKRRILPAAPCDLYLAVEKPADARMLLLRVSKSSIPESCVFPRARGCELRTVRMVDDREDQITLQLVLTGTQFTDIFTSLVQDITDHISGTSDEDQSVVTFIGRLNKWQHFLDQYGPEGLGVEAQQGLFGELWFLRQHVLTALDPLASINSWTGHMKTPQDFQFPGCAVEVKTSSGKQHQKLRIANERQLDDSVISPIFLFHISLDVRAHNGETLAEMVESVRSLVSTHVLARQSLEDSLHNGGYLDIHAYMYARTGYTIRETNIFRVNEGFPRIIETDLRNGVGDVQYSVSVAACMPHSVTEAELQSFITGR